MGPSGFERLPPEHLTMLLCIMIPLAGLVTIAVVWIFAFYWRKVRQNDTEASLKSQMLDRGMSADEIERVLRAGSNNRETVGSNSLKTQMLWAGSSGKDIERVLRAENEAALKSQMLDRGMTAEEIERVLKAGMPEFDSVAKR
jgi:hypothetical protein